MVKPFDSTWEEFERLRKLIPERPDFHLHNWGIWRRKDHVTDGYDERSAGLSTGGISGADAFAHLCEPVDEWAAHVSDSIIEGLVIQQRIALCHVYEASVWQFRSKQLLEDVLIEAARVFWVEALKRDLT